ncbi:hypothetical protein D3C81_2192170 [compost metagenome]
MFTVWCEKQRDAHILILTYPAFDTTGRIYFFNVFNILLFAKMLHDRRDLPGSEGQCR